VARVLGKKAAPARATLSFARGPIALTTTVGTLFLEVAQLLGTERETRNKHRLRTVKYWYRLQQTATAEALVRWEYDPGVLPRCRHHVQFGRPTTLQIGMSGLDLNRLHLPTGWVTIEEVIRFLITEMEVRAPCGEEWRTKLADSERRFFEEFTSKRHKPEPES
jgi:hypothetical protein